MIITLYKTGADPDYMDVIGEDVRIFLDDLEALGKSNEIDVPPFVPSLAPFTLEVNANNMVGNYDYAEIAYNPTESTTPPRAKKFYYFVSWDFVTRGTVLLTFTPDMITTNLANFGANSINGVFALRKTTAIVPGKQKRYGIAPRGFNGIRSVTPISNNMAIVAMFTGKKTGDARDASFTVTFPTDTPANLGAALASLSEVSRRVNKCTLIHNDTIVDAEFTGVKIKAAYYLPANMVTRPNATYKYIFTDASGAQIGGGFYPGGLQSVTFNITPAEANEGFTSFIVGAPSHYYAVDDVALSRLILQPSGVPDLGTLKITLYLGDEIHDVTDCFGVPVELLASQTELIQARISDAIGVASSAFSLIATRGTLPNAYLNLGQSITNAIFREFKTGTGAGDVVGNMQLAENDNGNVRNFAVNGFAVIEYYVVNYAERNADAVYCGYESDAVFNNLSVRNTAHFDYFEGRAIFHDETYKMPEFPDILARGFRLWGHGYFKN